MSLALALTCRTPLLYSQTDQEATAKQLFEQERWEQLVLLADGKPLRSAELSYEYGLALARLGRWNEAQSALQKGQALDSRDKRFPIELAGIAFKQKHQARAITYLRHALIIDPRDQYANDFLATLYFLQNNLEAAVKYWNRCREPKPRIGQVRIEPTPRVHPALLDHAFAFAPESQLAFDELQSSNSSIQALGIFPVHHFELSARPDNSFDVVFRGQELNGWGNSTLEALLRTFHGLPFQEITPEYFNFKRSAINVQALVRWDSDKRRANISLSTPLRQNPRWHARIAADARNENWDVTGFSGGVQPAAALNLRRESITIEASRVAGARWKWSAGLEFSHRDYRNVLTRDSFLSARLASGILLKQILTADYELWRLPERRLVVSVGASAQSGRFWAQQPALFEKLEAPLTLRWLPSAHGDDFATKAQLRAGRIFGQSPFDELFMLGLERDNDLWLRAHAGTRNGRKGSAPTGDRYLLANWETDKNIYSNGLFAVKLGPFLDTGKIDDLSPVLGSRKWLWDTGGQLKLRALHVDVAFSYGKDLRTGNHLLYARLGR